MSQRGAQLSGNAFSSVMFVKGEQGPAEKAGGALLSGPDGKALRAALLALKYSPQDWVALATWDDAGAPLSAELLRLAVMTLDPATLIACDEAAAQALRDAFAHDLCELELLEDALLEPGRVVKVAGMRVLNLGGFEQALASDRAKQLMWARLKQIPPLGEPY
ncbi:MAG: hypothetical protein Q4B54_00535 [Coriobacteriales bacterium]|nr:hypothetical protein [Coriobacteriales bacterium]